MSAGWSVPDALLLIVCILLLGRLLACERELRRVEAESLARDLAQVRLAQRAIERLGDGE